MRVNQAGMFLTTLGASGLLILATNDWRYGGALACFVYAMHFSILRAMEDK